MLHHLWVFSLFGYPVYIGLHEDGTEVVVKRLRKPQLEIANVIKAMSLVTLSSEHVLLYQVAFWLVQYLQSLVFSCLNSLALINLRGCMRTTSTST